MATTGVPTLLGSADKESHVCQDLARFSPCLLEGDD